MSPEFMINVKHALERKIERLNEELNESRRWWNSTPLSPDQQKIEDEILIHQFLLHNILNNNTLST